MRPLLSIVMPVYQVEAYLRDAVESVLAQTLTGDWELILVDDASPDGCGAICDKMAAEDARISVIHLNENGGLSNARNVGMRQAKGKYLMFMDSDDRIDRELLETLKNAVSTNAPAQMVVWGLIEEHYSRSGEIIERRRICARAESCKSAEEVKQSALHLEQKTLLGYAWNKLYDREMLLHSGVQFENVRLIEDIVFNLSVLPHVQRMCVLDVPMYYYARRTSGSLTHRFIPDYYELSMRRVKMMLDMYAAWGMGEAAAKVLAPIYVRYTISALSRNCDARAQMTHKKRLEFVRTMRKSDLHSRLKDAMGQGSGVHALIGRLIASGNGFVCLLMGWVIYFVQCGMKGLFLKLSRKEDV